MRLPQAAILALASVAALVAIGLASWRALVAASVGAIAYYAAYNSLFFLVHGYEWSLSAFNSEDLIDRWMNGRMLEAALSMLAGAAIAGIIYPFLRRRAFGARGPHLAGWLTLGPATALVILATLGLQVAWFVWWWGVVPDWRLPDLLWAFKYDLDLVQATAVGAAALVSPVVTWLIGRYHPKARPQGSSDEDDDAAGSPVPDEPLVPALSGSAAAKE
jgi:hypothetical protein